MEAPTVKTNPITAQSRFGHASGQGSSILGFSEEPQFFGEMQIPKKAVCSRLAAILQGLFIDSFGGGTS